MTWYESLSYDTNPFSIKPSQMYLSDAKVAYIVNVIEQGRIINLHGTFGSGKTTLTKHIIKEYSGQQRIIYFSCNRIVDTLDIDRLLWERRSFWQKVFGKAPKNVILLLDEADSLKDDEIKNVFDYHKRGLLASVVLISHEKLKLNKTQAKKTFFVDSQVHADTAIQLVRARIGNHPLMTDQIITAIFEKDKRMRYFLANCDKYMKNMIERGRKTAKISDVKRIL